MTKRFTTIWGKNRNFLYIIELMGKFLENLEMLMRYYRASAESVADMLDK